MLLRVPAGHVADKVSRERDGAVVITICAAKRTEEIVPLRRLVELIRVVEGVPCLMTHVHHDLASVFEVVHAALKLRQVWVGEVKRNADDRLAGGTAPFVSEVAQRAELVDALGLQFAIELLNESVKRRTFELEPEVADWLGEDLLELCSGFLEVAHVATQSSIPPSGISHGKAYRLCT